MTVDQKLPDRLEPGEHLLWSGGPSAGILLTRGVIGCLVCAAAFVLALRLAGPAFTEMSAGEVIRIAFEEQPVPSAIAGLFVLLAPFSQLLRFGRHRYAVTDRRLLAWRGSGKLYWELPAPVVLYVFRGFVPLFGRSDLRFNRMKLGEKHRWTSFQALSDPTSLAGFVEEWLRGHGEAARTSCRDRQPHTAGAGGFSIELPSGWIVEHRYAATDEPAVVLTAFYDGSERIAPGRGAERSESNVIVAHGPCELSLVVESHPGEPPEDRPAQSGAGKLGQKLAQAYASEREPVRHLGLEGERSVIEQHGRRVVGPRLQEVRFSNEVRILRGAGRWYRSTARWPFALPAAEEALGELIGTWSLATDGAAVERQVQA